MFTGNPETEAEFRYLNVLPSIKGSLSLGVGYLAINLKRIVGTHLCRDEKLMKHLSVTTVY